MAISRRRLLLTTQLPDRCLALRGKRRSAPQPSSIFDGEPLPDFVDPLFERVEPGMQGAVVEIEDIAKGKQSENPVVAFDISQHRFDRMADKGDNAQQRVHVTPFPAKLISRKNGSAPPERSSATLLFYGR